MSNGAGKFSPFPKMHLYFYSRCNGNDMGKICRNPGGSGDPPYPFLGAPMVSGSGISLATCKSAPCSRQITTPSPHHSVFYRPYAIPAAQPTASKHRRHPVYLLQKYSKLVFRLCLVKCYCCRVYCWHAHTGGCWCIKAESVQPFDRVSATLWSIKL